MKNSVFDFCKVFHYPEEAVKTLGTACDALSQNEDASAGFSKYIELYSADKLTDYNDVFTALDQVSVQCNIHRYTIHLLFFINLAKHMEELYKKKNLPYVLYYDAMLDLKWKLLECHERYGIWGTFVKEWFPGFFQLTRFALGRLQFELMKYGHHYSQNGFKLSPEDLVINVHIPSSGHLRQEDCHESYQQAAEFFKDCFRGRPVAFVCNSWLLFPPNRRFLPESSNIVKFMDDYDITIFEEDAGEGLWVIFNTDYHGNTGDLPNSTSLQRAYIAWLKEGNKPGTGQGVFLWGEIIAPKKAKSLCSNM